MHRTDADAYSKPSPGCKALVVVGFVLAAAIAIYVNGLLRAGESRLSAEHTQAGPEAAGDRPRTISIAGRQFRVPRSRGLRLTLGVLLVIGGAFGFLPILGFWMAPLGLLLLSVDLPPIRRMRRRTDVWVGRKTTRLRQRAR